MDRGLQRLLPPPPLIQLDASSSRAHRISATSEWFLRLHLYERTHRRNVPAMLTYTGETSFALITHDSGSRGPGRAISFVCEFVCLSVLEERKIQDVQKTSRKLQNGKNARCTFYGIECMKIHDVKIARGKIVEHEKARRENERYHHRSVISIYFPGKCKCKKKLSCLKRGVIIQV